MKSEHIFGYGYDLWIFCVGGKDILPEALSDDKLQCRTQNYSGRDSFAFPICDSEGCFCDFVSVQCEVGGTIFIKESKTKEPSYFAVPWRDENELSDVKHITVDEEYKESINKAIDRALAFSPVRKLYINIRCQCRDKANIIGMLSADKMKELINRDDLLGNILYAVYDPILEGDSIIPGSLTP